MRLDFYLEEGCKGLLVGTVDMTLTKQETVIPVHLFNSVSSLNDEYSLNTSTSSTSSNKRQSGVVEFRSIDIKALDADVTVFLYSPLSPSPFAEIITHAAVEMSIPLLTLDYDFGKENVEFVNTGTVHRKDGEPWILDKLVVKHQSLFHSLRG